MRKRTLVHNFIPERTRRDVKFLPSVVQVGSTFSRSEMEELQEFLGEHFVDKGYIFTFHITRVDQDADSD